MSKTKTEDQPLEPEVGANPLEGYSVAVQTCIDVASGKSRSRIRLDAAQMLFEHCSEPPFVDWDFEPLLDDDEA